MRFSANSNRSLFGSFLLSCLAVVATRPANASTTIDVVPGLGPQIHRCSSASWNDLRLRSRKLPDADHHPQEQRHIHHLGQGHHEWIDRPVLLLHLFRPIHRLRQGRQQLRRNLRTRTPALRMDPGPVHRRCTADHPGLPLPDSPPAAGTWIASTAKSISPS